MTELQGIKSKKINNEIEEYETKIGNACEKQDIS